MSGKLSSSEYRKQKEIEEARKDGTLPPERDAEGNLINPHNPEYITKVPWYLGETGATLQHQSIQQQQHLLSITEADELYKRGKKKQVATKWRKGACKNCGAMSHKTTECVERPRARGAWKTNKDISQDEVFVDVRSENYGKLTFDAKRDHWLGYDPSQHDETIERYEKIEKVRQKQKMKQLNTELGDKKSRAATTTTTFESDSDSDFSDSDDDDDEFKQREGGRVISKRVARQGGVGGAELKTTVRNLRIREDTAKYLRNLNPESAYYDPKTRSMRENPTPDVKPEDLVFAGDNFIRNSGDTTQLAKTELFAWEAEQKGGVELHPQATPSQVEFMRRQFEEKKKTLEKNLKQQLFDKYGGQQHMQAPPVDMLLAQSENYTEYSRDGRVIKGAEKAILKSKYVEDVLENNHTQIWGSYFDVGDMTWGYGCCHSKVRNSYCAGQAGKVAIEAAVQHMLLPTKVLDDKKLKKSKRKETDERKRAYTSASTCEVDAEEMEAYRMKRLRSEDPMAKFLKE